MVIEIIKASKASYWYADQIGLRYETIREQEDIYEVVKWTVYPLKYDIAPILKVDCKEIHIKSKSVDTNSPPDWRARVNSLKNIEQSIERSGHKMKIEIEYYEKLNKEAEIKSVVKKNKEEAPE